MHDRIRVGPEISNPLEQRNPETKAWIEMWLEASTMLPMPQIRTFLKRSLILSLSVVWLASCGNQDGRKTTAPFEPILPFEPVKTAGNTSHPGYELYVKNCYECHQQAHPATLSVEKWKNTVPFMAKHAGVSEADGKKILDYILHMKSRTGQ